MKMRKETKAQQIQDMMTEISNRRDALTRIWKEAEALNLKEMAGEATAKDQERARELREIATVHMDWINIHTPIIKNFYAPAA